MGDNAALIDNTDNAEHFVSEFVFEPSDLGKFSSLNQSMMSGFADERTEDEWEFENDLDDVEPIYILANVEMNEPINLFSAEDSTKQSLAFGIDQVYDQNSSMYFLDSLDSEIALEQISKEKVSIDDHLNSPLEAQVSSFMKALPVDTYVDWHVGNQDDWSFTGEQIGLTEESELMELYDAEC